MTQALLDPVEGRRLLGEQTDDTSYTSGANQPAPAESRVHGIIWDGIKIKYFPRRYTLILLCFTAVAINYSDRTYVDIFVVLSRGPISIP